MAQPDHSWAGRFQPPEVRPRQILAATAALADEHGLDGVAIVEVASAAGIAGDRSTSTPRRRAELIDALQADLWPEMLDHPAQVGEHRYVDE